jgi:hypothetical protein
VTITVQATEAGANCGMDFYTLAIAPPLVPVSAARAVMLGRNLNLGYTKLKLYNTTMLQIPSQERELMATVYLKDGTKVEIPIEELGEYLEANRDLIQVQKLKSRRGPIRSKVAAETNRLA